jgi:hypothetical protein
VAHSHEMRVGEVYVCGDCRVELKVIKECQDAGDATHECACDVDGFQCCGKPLTPKEQAQ